MKNAVLNTSCVRKTGRSSGWPKTNRAPSRRSWSTRRPAISGRAGSRTPARRTTAAAESPAATPNAGAPPVHPTSAPASAGPPAKATVRASSIRPLAAANAPAGTSAGTSAGAATLYATVPHAPMKPSSASSGSVNRFRCASVRTPASESARSASAPAMSRRREARSASTPAGIESRRNGSVCAVCNSPVAPAPAPSASTATMGAAARPICSADCAARLDHASRLKLAGSRGEALSWNMLRAYGAVPHARTPHVAAEFRTRRYCPPVRAPACAPYVPLPARASPAQSRSAGGFGGGRRGPLRRGWGAKPPSESAHVERLAQPVADEVDGEDGQREEEAGEQDDPERELHVRLALGHDVAPRRDVGRRAGAEERQVRLEQDGRGADVGRLHDERRSQRGQDVEHQDSRRAGAERARAVDRPRVDVAAEVVGAEPVSGHGAREALDRPHLERIAGPPDRRERAAQGDDREHHDADHERRLPPNKPNDPRSTRKMFRFERRLRRRNPGGRFGRGAEPPSEASI